jgi:acylphosphatase
MVQTVSITIRGKVQGVYYRQSTRQQAIALHITGTVANHPDGTVLIVATGTQQQLDQLIEWCKTGPPRATVTGMQVQEQPLQLFREFEIIR